MHHPKHHIRHISQARRSHHIRNLHSVGSTVFVFIYLSSLSLLELFSQIYTACVSPADNRSDLLPPSSEKVTTTTHAFKHMRSQSFNTHTSYTYCRNIYPVRHTFFTQTTDSTSIRHLSSICHPNHTNITSFMQKAMHTNHFCTHTKKQPTCTQHTQTQRHNIFALISSHLLAHFSVGVFVCSVVCGFLLNVICILYIYRFLLVYPVVMWYLISVYICSVLYACNS